MAKRPYTPSFIYVISFNNGSSIMAFKTKKQAVKYINGFQKLTSTRLKFTRVWYIP